MYNEDLDALAAEYVLGTLSADERAHAESMLGGDPGFVEIVRQWERRLGELNVMVEAVEPPPESWDKIKSEIGTVAQRGDADLTPLVLGVPPSPAGEDSETKTKADDKSAGGEPSSAAAEGSGSLSEAGTVHEAQSESEPGSELESHPEAEREPALESEAESETESAAVAPTPADLLLSPSPPQAERSADVVSLTHRVRRWRRSALGCGAIAAILAALIVVSLVKPGLIPGKLHLPQLVAQFSPPPPAAATPPVGQLIAVLQQDPSAPAFLLTLDPAARKMTVRDVAAKGEAGHSFQLWFIGSRTAAPLSLGLIGAAEYTELSLPADIGTTAMQAATYAVSFEPAGGSKTGAPTGPILFRGKLVESVPPPPASKT
jgi:anti-sigma-K factor RskA